MDYHWGKVTRKGWLRGWLLPGLGRNWEGTWRGGLVNSSLGLRKKVGLFKTIGWKGVWVWNFIPPGSGNFLRKKFGLGKHF